MKKMSYLAAAFVMGVLLSVTINACGGDTERVEPGGTQNPSGGSGNEGGTAGPANMWDYGIGKVTKSYEYDESGNEWLSYEIRYDSQKREIGSISYYTYTDPVVSGKVANEQKNYKYSGNTCTYETVYYTYDNETGALISTKVTKKKTEYLE